MGPDSGLQSVPEVDANHFLPFWAEVGVLVPDDPVSDVATALD